MKTSSMHTLAAVVLSAVCMTVHARGPGGPGYGAGYQARLAASAPGAGPAGMGPIAARGGRGAQVGADFTPGWALMTEQERAEHRTRITAAKSHDECMAAMAEHREQITERAKSQGKTLGTPRRDTCAALKP